MKFSDQVAIRVSSGRGGAGCCSFRREKYVPYGGPDGGDGGNGGGIYIVGARDCNSLADFHNGQRYRAGNAQDGRGQQRHGANGTDLHLRVPLGCEVKNAADGSILLEMLDAGQPRLLLAGGRGGRGNPHFKTSTRQAPRQAGEGQPGQTLELILELKLIADVGLVGFPNAGKSTLISRLSRSRPKIAPYPFTTLTPNLGVALSPWGEQLVLADIPGLIGGAHAGRGLGRRFLRHVERTTLLLLVLDASLEQAELLHQYQALHQEMALFSDALAAKPHAVVLNKTDLLAQDAATLQAQLAPLLQGASRQPLWVHSASALSGQGIPELLRLLIPH